jgi:hypothetical protein
MAAHRDKGVFRRMILGSLIALGIGATATPAAAQWAKTQPGNITWLEAGWNEPFLTVRLDVPILNPGNCPDAEFYMIEAAASTTPLFSSVLLSAHMANRKVAIVVSGCVQGRPKIVGVQAI